jgi:hypothetical protein
MRDSAVGAGRGRPADLERCWPRSSFELIYLELCASQISQAVGKSPLGKKILHVTRFCMFTIMLLTVSSQGNTYSELL